MSRGRCGTTLLLALILAPTLAAHTGYRDGYDFPDQGDDWYGAVTAPDPRYDFLPRPSIESYSDGQDFGLGYEISVDLFGFGPPAELTSSSLHEYYFRFGALPVVPYTGDDECTSDSQCQDAVFCDGSERCDHGRCVSGTPPSCGDGDACTIDYCDPTSDACANDPIPHPGEVHDLQIDRAAPGSNVAALSWLARPLSDHYRLYRGEHADLSDLTCYDGAVLGTSLDDDGAIAAQQLLVYLVTGWGCGGESPLGPDSDGVQRVNAAPCP